MKRPSCAKHFLAAYGANWCPSHNFGSPIIICFSELFFWGQEKGMGTSQKDTQPWNLIELDFYNEMPSDRKHTPPTFLKPLHPITAHGTSIMITPKRTSGDDSEDLIILLISTCWISSTCSPENKKTRFSGWLVTLNGGDCQGIPPKMTWKFRFWHYIVIYPDEVVYLIFLEPGKQLQR